MQKESFAQNAPFLAKLVIQKGFEIAIMAGGEGRLVGGVVREVVAAIRRHDPGHPLADENGDVWEAPVDENAEMVEMLEASRQYRNMIEAMSTAKQLMLETMRMK